MSSEVVKFMAFLQLPIIVDKQIVIKKMGYKNPKDISAKILAEVDQVLHEAEEYLDPCIWYEELEFVGDEENKKIILPDGSWFQGKYAYSNLYQADYLIIALTTVGDKLDRISRECFQKGDFLRGLIFDIFGNVALDNLSYSFWLKIVEAIKSKNMGISCRLCPGDSDWHIKEQKVVFDILKDNNVKVQLNEHYMMDPVKSVSMVYGIGKNINLSKADHNCADCSSVRCPYRELPRESTS